MYWHVTLRGFSDELQKIAVAQWRTIARAVPGAAERMGAHLSPGGALSIERAVPLKRPGMIDEAAFLKRRALHPDAASVVREGTGVLETGARDFPSHTHGTPRARQVHDYQFMGHPQEFSGTTPTTPWFMRRK